MENLKQIQKRIKEIKKEILKINEMRPGSLSQQKRKNRNNEEYGTYWNLNYTFKNKTHTEYIRNELVEDVQKQVDSYKKFKILIEEWIEISIEYQKEKLKVSRQKLDE